MPVLTLSEFETRARTLRLLLFDVDGVLTDGSINVDRDGREFKRFYIRDGAAIVWANKAGLMTGVISARASGATTTRASELGMSVVLQGVPDKRAALADILARHEVRAEEVSFMGDDLVDLQLMQAVGLSCCPSDAAPEVAAAAGWVSAYGGGRGAVREFVEAVLRARGQWDDVLARFS